MCSINVMEAWAALRSYQVVSKFRRQPNIIEGDPSVVINALRGLEVLPWSIRSVLEECHNVCLEASLTVMYVHVFREANFIVDWLANLGHTASISCNSLAVGTFGLLCMSDAWGRITPKPLYN
uniref:RNase H type-1 domain-containing protein n=1 Tax=Nelumbo nucifera TaxID=4432 RepID=A0A822YUG3_NELNU|nr:TPA_asm: hypothetical protein HUJ06_006952 [Nelumbo nucifera]